MPQGKPLTVPDDGLSTRERRQQPLLMVHTGDGKGKSTAAFGLAIRAWNQGWNVGVFQFVKSAKWRIGEQTVLERLGDPQLIARHHSSPDALVAMHVMDERLVAARIANRRARSPGPSWPKVHSMEIARSLRPNKRALCFFTSSVRRRYRSNF